MKNLCLFFFLVLFSYAAKASDCYDTYVTHKIIKKQGAVYYQLTEKDQNGFSYVKQVNKLLNGVDFNTFELLSTEEYSILFADKNGFYVLPTNAQYEDNSAKFYKILNASNGQKHINGRLFLIDGKWTYLDAWQNTITKIVIVELPTKLTNVKFYITGIYVKSDQNVYAIKIDYDLPKKYELQIIANLSPIETVYYACNEQKNEDYLADTKGMFTIDRNGFFTDITPQLLALGVKNNFNKLNLIDSNIPFWLNNNLVLKYRDGSSRSGKNLLTGEDIDISYSYTSSKILKPLVGKTVYATFRNKIYPIWDDNFSTPYQIKTDVNTLKAIAGTLLQGTDFYYMETDGDFQIASTNIPASAKFFPSLRSEQKYLAIALVDDKYIHFLGDRFMVGQDDKKELTSKIVKQLGMFYLFNHSLYDGDHTFPIDADEESLSYLGSFVEVINNCSGDLPGSAPVAVKYHHFFKDKNNVYYFNEQAKKLQIIQTAAPEDNKPDDYENLQNLYKIKDIKGTVIKKTEQPLNYYLIAGCGLAVIGLGIYLFKVRR